MGALRVMFGSSVTGPFEPRRLGSIGLFCDDEEAELVVPADGPTRETGPTSPSTGVFVGLETARADEEVEEVEEDDGAPVSCLHSSL